jgi:hypothetical protein
MNLELKNKLWRAAELKGQPYFYIKKNSGWSNIEYDFWPIDFDLKEDIAKQFTEFAKKLIKKKQMKVWQVCTFGSTFGFITVRNDFLPVFENFIREKIFDKNNWEELTLAKVIREEVKKSEKMLSKKGEAET